MTYKFKEGDIVKPTEDSFVPRKVKKRPFIIEELGYLTRHTMSTHNTYLLKNMDYFLFEEEIEWYTPTALEIEVYELWV